MYMIEYIAQQDFSLAINKHNLQLELQDLVLERNPY